MLGGQLSKNESCGKNMLVACASLGGLGSDVFQFKHVPVLHLGESEFTDEESGQIPDARVVKSFYDTKKWFYDAKMMRDMGLTILCTMPLGFAGNRDTVAIGTLASLAIILVSKVPCQAPQGLAGCKRVESDLFGRF